MPAHCPWKRWDGDGEGEEEAADGEAPRRKVKRMRRNCKKFFEVTVKKLSMRSDAFKENLREHRLASCMEVNVGDFWCLEAITSEVEKKAFFEWKNDVLHPSDDYDGLVMMKVSFYCVLFLPSCALSLETDR